MALQKKNANLSYDSRSNFGFKGWWIIIFAALNWFMFNNLGSAAMNVILPNKAAALGVEQGVLLTYTTPAGIVAVILCFFFGKIAGKWGVKKTNACLLLFGALSAVLWAVSSSVLAYIFGIMLTFSFMSGTSLVAGNMAVTNWFPKKKGIAIGWATMGLNIGGAVIVPFLTAMVAKLGNITNAMLVLAACVAVLFVLNLVAFKDYPEQWNAYPDNDPTAERRTNYKINTGWTNAKVLKQKETWIMSAGNGIYQMITLGFVSTLVSSMIQKGFAPPQAITIMTVSCLIGLVGSYLCGFIDQKFGTQKASIIYGIWCAIGIAFYFVPGKAAALVYVLMLALSIGGSNNFPPSQSAQIFGRDGTIVAFPVIFMIKGVFAYLVYAILGQSLAHTGAYYVGWGIILVLAIVAAILFYICNLDPKKDPKDE